jgi:hypothetical protein
MRTHVKAWSVKEVGPDYRTRREHSDGSISFDGLSEVNITFDVTGKFNEVTDFVKAMTEGDAIQGITVKSKSGKGRRYVFRE